MTKSSTLLLAFSVSIALYGQNQRVIDSLVLLSETEISAEQKVNAYTRIAYEYSGLDSIKTTLFTKKARELSASIGYKKGLVDVWYVLSRAALLSGDYAKSEEYIAVVIDQATEIDYRLGLANGFFAQGWLHYYKGEYERSLEYHLKGLEIREAEGNKEDISNSLRGIGITYKLRGEFDQALYYLDQSLAIEQEIGNQNGIAESLNHIGIINSLRGNYASAMNSYFQALEIQKAVGDRSGLAYTYQNIGIIHNQQGDIEKTLEYYNQSLAIRKSIGETRGVAQITYNIGEVFHKTRQYDSALSYYITALDMKEGIGDRRGAADGYLNIGKLYTDQNKYSEAILFQERSLSIFNEISSDWGRANALIGLAQSHMGLRRFSKAKQSLNESLLLAQQAKLSESVKTAAGLLSEVERNLGNYRGAYEAKVLYQRMTDSLSNEEVTKRITLLEAEYLFKQEKDSIQFANDRQRLELGQQISEQRNVQIIAFIAIIVLFVTIIVLYRYYHLKNQSNKELTALNNEIRKTNQSLQELNTEKNNLIGIVAHDLQNPLSNIINAIQLIDSNEHRDDQGELTNIIKSTSSRMHKMINDILNVETIEKSAEEAEVKAYNLTPMVKEVCDQFKKRAAAKDISIKASLEENVIAIVDERFVIQVVENLLSNAIKFSPSGKTVEVSLSNMYGKSILEVKDEGPGLSEADKAKLFQRFQRLSAKPTGNESSTGLGLSIVKTFVESMGGRIWCESRIGEGATFIVELRMVKSSD